MKKVCAPRRNQNIIVDTPRPPRDRHSPKTGDKQNDPLLLHRQQEWVARLLQGGFNRFSELVGTRGGAHSAADTAQTFHKLMRVHTLGKA